MIDKNRVMRLYRRGYLHREIAEKMDCSRVQVSRIVARHKVYIDGVLHYYARRGDEFKAWYALAANEGITLNEIADYVGVSIQYVHEKITPYLRSY